MRVWKSNGKYWKYFYVEKHLWIFHTVTRGYGGSKLYNYIVKAGYVQWKLYGIVILLIFLVFFRFPFWNPFIICGFFIQSLPLLSNYHHRTDFTLFLLTWYIFSLGRITNNHIYSDPSFGIQIIIMQVNRHDKFLDHFQILQLIIENHLKNNNTIDSRVEK